MKLRNFRFAWSSLDINFLRQYFNTKIIIKAFVSAFLISNFIFLSMPNIEILNLISPFLTLYGIYMVINSSRGGFFATGFFVGTIWFYWIGISFIYYDLAFLVPLGIVGVSLVYGAMFYLASMPSFVFLRAIMLFLISYIHPFGFNWFNLEATLVIGAFEPNARGLISIFLGAICLSYLKNFYRFIAVFICLVCGLSFEPKQINLLPTKTTLVNTKIDQNKKWDMGLKDKFTNENLNLIQKAISEKKELIIFPESAFTLPLNLDKPLLSILSHYSKQITIVAGALAYEDKKVYNSTYLFQDGNFKRFDKVVLVPFGESIPLPDFIKDWINKVFFNSASDFASAKDFSHYKIKKTLVTNAICYEATTQRLYKDSPKIVIAISNNGWFIPSYEPHLQSLLLKYYATKNSTTIYHSVNGSKSEIIKPKQPYFTINFS